MTTRALVPIADGSEEIEAVCIIDTLRRAEVDVTVASVMGRRQITASRGTRIVADALIEDCAGEAYDLIVLPGGMPGAQHLGDSVPLIELVTAQRNAGRRYAAICAAPAVALLPTDSSPVTGRPASQPTCHGFAKRRTSRPWRTTSWSTAPSPPAAAPAPPSSSRWRW